MFGTKSNLRMYLNLTRAWAMGIQQRGWVRGDFEIVITDDPGGSHVVPIEEVKEHRTDPTHVIFPLRTYELDLLARLFLSRRVQEAVMNLNQAINSFNAALDAVNRASDRDTKYALMILLHAGVIGTRGTGGLFDAWTNADNALSGR